MSKWEGWTDRRVRKDVAFSAELLSADGQSETVQVDNLSEEGCCVLRSFDIGERIELELPGRGRVNAQVRWTIGGRSGVRFAAD